jgi:hypothetical protein
VPIFAWFWSYKAWNECVLGHNLFGASVLSRKESRLLCCPFLKQSRSYCYQFHTRLQLWQELGAAGLEKIVFGLAPAYGKKSWLCVAYSVSNYCSISRCFWCCPKLVENHVLPAVAIYYGKKKIIFGACTAMARFCLHSRTYVFFGAEQLHR